MSLRAPPSTDIGNDELMHECSPNHSRMGTAKIEGRTVWEQLQITKKITYIHITKQHSIIVHRVTQIFHTDHDKMHNESYRLFRKYASLDIPDFPENIHRKKSQI